MRSFLSTSFNHRLLVVCVLVAAVVGCGNSSDVDDRGTAPDQPDYETPTSDSPDILRPSGEEDTQGSLDEELCEDPDCVVMGMVDSDGRDEKALREAFGQAVDQLRAGKDVRLELQDGEYSVDGSARYEVDLPYGGSFNLDARLGIVNVNTDSTLTIAGGENTVLRLNGFDTMGVVVANSSNIVLQDLKIDYTQSPISQGHVHEIGSSSVTIKVDPGYMAPRLFRTKSKGYVIPFINGEYPSDLLSDISFKSITKVASGDGSTHDGIYRLEQVGEYHAKSLRDSYQIHGDKMKLVAASKIGQEPILLSNCTNCTLRNVHISNSPAVAVRANSGGSDLEIDGLVYEPARVGDRAMPLMAGVAGGIIVQSMRGGLKIRNSRLHKNADDQLGLFNRAVAIDSVSSARSLELSAKSAAFLRVGDGIDLHHKDTYMKLNDSPIKVTALSVRGDNRLDVQLGSDLPAGVSSGFFLSTQAAAVGTESNPMEIVGNDLTDNKGRAIRTNASWGYIGGNNMNNNGNGGIWIGADAKSNAPCSVGLTVEGNKITNQYHGSSMILWNGSPGTSSSENSFCNRSITFRSNKVYGATGEVPAIWIDNGYDIEVSDNNMSDVFGGPVALKSTLHDHMVKETSGNDLSKFAIIVNNAQSVTLKNNVDDGRDSLYHITTEAKDVIQN